MVGWHQWWRTMFEQAPGVGDGQESLACCSPCDHKESDMTEQLNWITDEWENLLFRILIQYLLPYTHSSVFTHTLPRAIIYIFIIHFIFEATTFPNSKIYCWFQRSQCLLKIYSLNLLALICLFLHFVITFSLLQKILLLYEKLLTSLLLTLVK